MKKIYAVLIGLLTIISIGWVIQLTIEGKPVAKIKLSEFETPKNLSDAVKMRLRQEIKDHPIVFLGVDPEEPSHLEVWKHFINEMDEPGWKFDELLIEQGLSLKEPWRSGEKMIDVKENEMALKTAWNDPSYKEKRIVVVVPNIYSSQLIKDNPVQRLKLNPNEGRILSLSIVPLGQNANEVEINRLPCVAEGADYTGQSPLGCMIRKKARFVKKPFHNKSYLGAVEQVGLHDYLVYLRKPPEVQ